VIAEDVESEALAGFNPKPSTLNSTHTPYTLHSTYTLRPKLYLVSESELIVIAEDVESEALAGFHTPLTHSLPYFPTHSLTHSSTLSHTLTHSLSHSRTHSPTPRPSDVVSQALAGFHPPLPAP